MKSNEEPVRQFVVTAIREPFFRAGWSNLGIFFAVIAALLSQKIAIEFDLAYGVSLLVAAFAGIFFLAMYTRSVSRIAIENSSIQFTCAVHRESLNIRDIKRIKVFVFRPSFWVIIIVLLHDRIFPRYFDFSAFNPNDMEFSAAVTQLRKFLEDTGAAVTQPRELFNGPSANDL